MLMAENLLLMRRRYRTSVSAAALFLAAYGPLGMVLDFADASVAIVSSGGALDYQSQGQVSGGALVGPGAKLTYTAPSLKLTEQADGFIKFQAHNLCLWSEDFSGSNWTKSAALTRTLTQTDPRGGNTAALYTGFAGGFQAINPGTGASVLVGATYTFEIWLKGNGTVTLDWNGWSGATTVTTTSTWTKFSNTAVAATSTAVPRVISYGGNTATDVYVAFAHIRRTPSASDYIKTTTAAAYDLPYVYSSGVRTGIMVEPAATNLIPQSAMGTGLGSWNGNNSTRTLSAEIDPFGGYAAMQIATNGNGGLNVSQPVSVTPGSVYTASIFLKGTPGEKIFFMADAAFQVEVTFTGQWQRITKTFTATTSTTYFGCERYNRSGGAHLPDVTFHATGAQLETGTVATSPIITYGSTALRAADNISIDTGLVPHTATEGTLYAQYVRKYDLFSFAAQLDDGTNANSIALVVSDTADSRNLISSGGALQANIGNTHAPTGVLAQQAISWASNRANNSTNGSIGTEDTSVTVPTVNTIRLGDRVGGGRSMTGVISKIAYFPERKADAVLQTMTGA